MLLLFSVSAFSQGLFATVTGTVSDSSGRDPGRHSEATGGTGSSRPRLNEAGAYNFSNLLPGSTLNIPARFSNENHTATIKQNTTYRYNFELARRCQHQVEVSISAGTILATSGASVGQVLNQQKVQDLPLVGNNILDLITVMAGVENIIPTNPPVAGNAFGREQTTFAGVRADNISVVRDGIQVQDNGGFQLARNSRDFLSDHHQSRPGRRNSIDSGASRVELGRVTGHFVYDSVRNQQVLGQRELEFP
jgi:hypothetical protein